MASASRHCRLDVLIKLAQSAVDDRRLDLVAADQREAELRGREVALTAAIAEELSLCSEEGVGLPLGVLWSVFVADQLQSKRRLVEERAQAEDAAMTARAALSDAHRDLKSLENAEREREKRQAAAEAALEQSRLDEAASQSHARTASQRRRLT